MTSQPGGPGSISTNVHPSTRRAWAEVIPFFAFPDEVRRIIYTTDSIEALNSKLRRAVRATRKAPGKDFLRLKRKLAAWDDNFLASIITA